MRWERFFLFVIEDKSVEAIFKRPVVLWVEQILAQSWSKTELKCRLDNSLSLTHILSLAVYLSLSRSLSLSPSLSLSQANVLDFQSGTKNSLPWNSIFFETSGLVLEWQRCNLQDSTDWTHFPRLTADGSFKRGMQSGTGKSPNLEKSYWKSSNLTLQHFLVLSSGLHH